MKSILLTLFLTTCILSAGDGPTFLGPGSKRSTLGKISKQSTQRLWTGFWRPIGVTTSTPDYEWQSEIMAWPNPTTGELNFPYSGKVKIVSLTGEEIFCGEVNESLDISRFSSGSYLIITEKTNKAIKIIKQ